MESITQSIGETKYDGIVGLIARHAERLLYEDLFFPLLREAVKEVGDELKNECLNKAIWYRLCRSDEECSERCNFADRIIEELSRLVYAWRNEPVRIGTFRTLLNEMHFRIHGDIVGTDIDAVTHGIILEAKRRIDIIIEGGSQTDAQPSSSIGKKSYSIGIDYIRISRYPNNNPSTCTRYNSVVVPLFVIAKSGDKNEIEKLKEDLDKAIGATLNDIKGYAEYKHPQLSGIEIALENMKSFTRVVLTRTVDIDVNKYVDRAELIDKIRRRLQDHRCLESIDDLTVYTDIICGLMNIVLRDIPRLYQTVTSDEALAGLGANDWISALLMLEAPLVNIETTSATSPPKDGGVDVGNLVEKARKTMLMRVDQVFKAVDKLRDELYETLRQTIHEKLEKIASESKVPSGGILVPLERQ